MEVVRALPETLRRKCARTGWIPRERLVRGACPGTRVYEPARSCSNGLLLLMFSSSVSPRLLWGECLDGLKDQPPGAAVLVGSDSVPLRCSSHSKPGAPACSWTRVPTDAQTASGSEKQRRLPAGGVWAKRRTMKELIQPLLAVVALGLRSARSRTELDRCAVNRGAETVELICLLEKAVFKDDYA